MRWSAAQYVRGGNRKLSVLALALLMGLGFVLLGPPASWVAERTRELREREASFERWQKDFQRYHPISDSEREAWRARFDRLLDWLPEAEDEAQQIAAVARLFETDSTKDFEVQADRSLEDVGFELSDSFEVQAALDARSFSFQAVPLQLSFKCGYQDLRALLRALEGKEIPVYVESVRVRRLFSDVEVRLQLVVFLRGSVSS